MRQIIFIILAVLGLLVSGCGGSGGDSFSAQAPATNSVGPQGTVRIQSVLARAVPSSVTDFRISGFDLNGNLLFGPVVRAKAATIELTMSTAVTRIQIEYLVGSNAVGLTSQTVVIQTDQVALISDPPFQDISTSLSQITLTPNNPSIAKGTSVNVSALALFSDNAQVDFSNSVTWTSSNPAVATVNAVGQVTSVSEGTTSIRATFGSVTASVTLTVTPATIVSLAVTPSPVSLAAGTSAQLTATATFTDNTQQDVSANASWASGAPATTSVSPSGQLSALAVGNATVTASFMGQQGAASVTVTPATLASIVVTPANPSLAAGTSTQLTATGVFTDSSTQDLTSSAVWSTGSTSVANVTPTGLLGGVAVGNTTVQATFNGVTGSTNATISAAVVTAINVTPSAPSVAAGLTQQFTATAIFSDATQQDVTSSASWISSAPTVASVNGSGLASTLITGQSTITANVGAVSGGATLNVTAAVVTGLAISPGNPTVAAGLTQQFTATATLSDNSTQDVTKRATWLSSQTGFATITPSGLATAVGLGTTTISSSFSGQNASTTLTVTPAVITSVSVTPPTPSIASGTTQQFTATATLSDSTTQDVTNTASWTSATPATATIGGTGLATSLAQGTSVVTAMVNGVSGNATLTVTAPTVTSIAVTPGNTNLASGLTQQLTAIATFTDSSTQDVTNSATWVSSQTSFATITPSGLTSAISPGTTSIGASFGGLTGNTNLTVTPAVITSVSVTPPTPSIALGTSQQFAAVATLSDSTTQVVTNTANWSSGSPATATVNTTGLATSAAQGNTVITAMVGGVSASASLTVTAPTVVSVSVTPGNPSIADGLTQQFAALATFSDSSTQDVTGTASWVSGTPATATVNPVGLASALAPGTTSISATFGGQTGNTALTVTPAVVTSIAVTPINPSIALGTTQQFAAVATLSDSSTQDVSGTANWSSGTPATATINATGLATSAAQGTTLITAMVGGVTGSTTLTVTAPTVVSVAVTPANPTVVDGTTQQFTATATFSDSTTQNVTNTAGWTSSQTGFATISPTGLATGVNAGVTTITASFGGQSGNTSLTVTPATIVSIAVTPPNPSITDGGGTQQFTATATLSDSNTQDVTNTATWASSQTGFATINTTGLASGVAPGVTNITASVGAVSGSTNLTVTSSVTLVSIAIDPPVALSSPGTTRQYRATGTFSDSTTMDITNQVTWSSSHPSVTLSSANPTHGLATISLSAPVNTGSNLENVSVTASMGAVNSNASLRIGRFLYTLDGATHGHRIQPSGASSSFAFINMSNSLRAVIDPTGRFYYALETATNQLVFYPMDLDFGIPTTGAGVPVATGTQPTELAMDPSGRYLFVSNQTSGEISAYRVQSNGTLAANGSAMDTQSLTPASLVVDPSGRYLFVYHESGTSLMNGQLSTFAIAADGTISFASRVTTTGIALGSTVAVHPNGQFVYLARPGIEVRTYSIGAGGALAPVGTPLANPGTAKLAMRPDGQFLYGLDTTNHNLVTYAIAGDGTVSVLSTVATSPTADSPRSLAIDATGRFLYITHGSVLTVASFSLAPAGPASFLSEEAQFTAQSWVLTSP